jgi:AhpD family alkylhydroperoxidase
MADVVARVALRRAIGQIRYLRPVPPGRADPPTAEVYRQLESDFGMLAPPIALHAAVPELLAASWLMLRESLVADAVLPRSSLEAVAAAVSAGNACPYCVTVHRATEQALAGAGSAATVEGWSRLAADRNTAGRPPGTAAEAARLVGVVATFHYLNRLVNVFLAPSPLPSAVPDLLRGPMLQILGRFTGANASRHHPAGESLWLLPATPGHPRPAWAAADPIVGEAFARAAAAIDRVAVAEVPASVRQLLPELLDSWDGRDPGLDTGWLAEPVAGLPLADRPAGRLALLTAFASYRISEQQVRDFRLAEPGDSALLALISWAAMAAAQQIVSWIPAPAVESSDHRGNA